jgi:hypothetical protein
VEKFFKLRNGRVSNDVRLDRLVQFDERSRNYSISEIKNKKKLRSYTWLCEDYFDQGKEGECVGYALGHELAARPAEVKGLTDKFLIEKIYWEAQKIDPWEGGSYPEANPKYEGTSILAGVKIVKNLNYIKEYRWAFNIDDVVYGIGHNGPAVFGLNWYDGMFKPDSEGFIKPTGELLGGHAILGRAIDIKKGFITLRNSWGRNWGIDGDCYLRIEDLEKLLKEYGECCFLMKRTVKP